MAKIGEELKQHWYCKRTKENTLYINGKPMGLCARCFGFWTGVFVSLFIYPILHMTHHLPKFYIDNLLLASLLILPGALDIGTTKTGFRKTNNRIRVITGLLMGAGVGLLTYLDLIILSTYI